MAIDVAHELGVLAEASRSAEIRAREDRETTRIGFKAVGDTLESIRGDLNRLVQSVDTTGKLVHGIALERAGARLDTLEHLVTPVDGPDLCKRVEALERNVVEDGHPMMVHRVGVLEDRAQKIDKWLGTGWTFIGKLALVIVGSSAFFNVVGKVLDWVLAHQ